MQAYPKGKNTECSIGRLALAWPLTSCTWPEIPSNQQCVTLLVIWPVLLTWQKNHESKLQCKSEHDFFFLSGKVLVKDNANTCGCALISKPGFCLVCFQEEKSFCWLRDLILYSARLAAALKSSKPIHRKPEVPQTVPSKPLTHACLFSLVAILLKGLPLPLGWLWWDGDRFSQFAQVVWDFSCDPTWKDQSFWTAPWKAFWSHGHQCHQLHFTVRCEWSVCRNVW